MLPRKKLVPLKREFKRIHQTGKIFDSPSFGLVVSYGAADGPKAAFVVSKKIDKRSVVRHEVKRKLSLAVELFLPRLGKNVELVFLAKQKAGAAATEELAAEMEQVLKRERLLS